MPDVNLSPYSAQAAQIEQRRRMAEMLSQQAMQPLDTNQTAGGYVIPVSPFAGLAKVLQGYAGGVGQRKAGEEQKALAERYRGDQMGDMTALAKMLSSPGSPATPERPPVLDPQESAQMADYGSPMPPNIPAQAAMAPGQISPDMMGQFKTPEGQQMAMAQLLAQVAPKTPIKGSAGDVFFNPSTGKQMFSVPERPEFGTTPHYELQPDGTTHAILFSKNGERKDLGVAKPQNQFNAPTVDANNSLALKWYEFNNLSTAERARLENEGKRLGISAAELFFNTGQGAGNAGAALPPNAPPPNFAQVPQAGQPAAIPPVSRPNSAQIPPQRPMGAPVVPQVAPRPALPPGMTGATQQALIKARGEMDTKRDFNMGGLNASLDEAEKILTGTGKKSPTSSGVGSLVDSAAGFFGASPRGAAEADKLRSIGGALVAKMPRMEGPQSDKDVLMYREMAGRIGDDSIPIERRLAALNTVRTLYAKYDKGPQTGGASGGWGIRPIP